MSHNPDTNNNQRKTYTKLSKNKISILDENESEHLNNNIYKVSLINKPSKAVGVKRNSAINKKNFSSKLKTNIDSINTKNSNNYYVNKPFSNRNHKRSSGFTELRNKNKVNKIIRPKENKKSLSNNLSIIKKKKFAKTIDTSSSKKFKVTINDEDEEPKDKNKVKDRIFFMSNHITSLNKNANRNNNLLKEFEKMKKFNHTKEKEKKKEKQISLNKKIGFTNNKIKTIANVEPTKVKRIIKPGKKESNKKKINIIDSFEKIEKIQ